MKDERLDEIDVVRIDKKNGRVHVFGRKKVKSFFKSMRTEYHEIICSYDSGDIFAEEAERYNGFNQPQFDYWTKVNDMAIKNIADENLKVEVFGVPFEILKEMFSDYNPVIFRDLVLFAKKFDLGGENDKE